MPVWLQNRLCGCERKYQKLKCVIETLQLLIKHAFSQLNMHKTSGGTITKEVADMFVRVLGFQLEGVKKSEIYKNRKYHDAYLFGKLFDECGTESSI